MRKRKKVEDVVKGRDNESLRPMEAKAHTADSNLADVLREKGKALDPEEVKAFWDRYSSRIRGRLKKIERRQSESVRWARETLIR